MLSSPVGGAIKTIGFWSGQVVTRQMLVCPGKKRRLPKVLRSFGSLTGKGASRQGLSGPSLHMSVTTSMPTSMSRWLPVPPGRQGGLSYGHVNGALICTISVKPWTMLGQSATQVSGVHPSMPPRLATLSNKHQEVSGLGLHHITGRITVTTVQDSRHEFVQFQLLFPFITWRQPWGHRRPPLHSPHQWR